MANPAQTHSHTPPAGVVADAKTGNTADSATGASRGNKKNSRPPTATEVQAQLQQMSQGFESRLGNLKQVFEHNAEKKFAEMVGAIQADIVAIKAAGEKNNLTQAQVVELQGKVQHIEDSFNALVLEVPKMRGEAKQAMISLAEHIHPRLAREMRGDEEPGFFEDLDEMMQTRITYKHVMYIGLGVGAIILLGVIGDRWDVPGLNLIPIPGFLRKDEEGGTMELPNGSKPRMQMPARAQA